MAWNYFFAEREKKKNILWEFWLVLLLNQNNPDSSYTNSLTCICNENHFFFFFFISSLVRTAQLRNICLKMTMKAKMKRPKKKSARNLGRWLLTYYKTLNEMCMERKKKSIFCVWKYFHAPERTWSSNFREMRISEMKNIVFIHCN